MLPSNGIARPGWGIEYVQRLSRGNGLVGQVAGQAILYLCASRGHPRQIPYI